jgi:hypothetical protein
MAPVTRKPSKSGPTANDGLRAENLEALNEQFYSGQPWIYFLQRLANLMLIASGDEAIERRFADGISLGALNIAIQRPAPDVTPSAEQTFAAIESQLLLHHAAETTLRFAYAHAEPDPCPWLRMARLTNAGQFKAWVDDELVTPAAEQVDALVMRLFVVDDASEANIRTLTDWLRLFASEFLDAAPYNAAKHGMALQAAAQQWQIEVDGQALLSADGASLDWLAVADVDGRRRWARTSRILSVEGTAMAVFAATRLMAGMWDRARAEHLGDEREPFTGLADLQTSYAAVGLRHHVIADMERALAYDDTPERTLRIRTRHLGLGTFDSSGAGAAD